MGATAMERPMPRQRWARQQLSGQRQREQRQRQQWSDQQQREQWQRQQRAQQNGRVSIAKRQQWAVRFKRLIWVVATPLQGRDPIG